MLSNTDDDHDKIGIQKFADTKCNDAGSGNMAQVVPKNMKKERERLNGSNDNLTKLIR